MMDWNYSETKKRSGETIKDTRRIYLHLYYNNQKATDDKTAFNKMLDGLEEELLSGNPEHEKAVLFKSYTMQELLDDLDIIECYEQPGHRRRIGEMTKKQMNLFDWGGWIFHPRYKCLGIQVVTVAISSKVVAALEGFNTIVAASTVAFLQRQRW